MSMFFYMPAVQRMDFLSRQISESGLIEILEKVSQQTDKKTTVTVSSSETSLVWFIISHLSALHHLCSVLVSSTGGGWWTRTMRMITNFKPEPWNTPRNRERIYFTGTLIASLTSWILGCHTSFCVSLETTHQEERTTQWSWHCGISGGG